MIFKKDFKHLYKVFKEHNAEKRDTIGDGEF